MFPSIKIQTDGARPPFPFYRVTLFFLVNSGQDASDALPGGRVTKGEEDLRERGSTEMHGDRLEVAPIYIARTIHVAGLNEGNCRARDGIYYSLTTTAARGTLDEKLSCCFPILFEPRLRRESPAPSRQSSNRSL